MKYYLCLGTNTGNRGKNLDTALARIKRRGMKIKSCSSRYETAPVEMPGEKWFFNQVVEVETNLAPADLLEWIKRTEKEMGRVVSEKRKSRIIDIDILLAEEHVIQTEKLRVPHPLLAERNFVMVPLAEIAADVIHPVFNKKIGALLLDSKDPHQVKIINTSRC